MGKFGGFYFGEKKKLKKQNLEKRAKRATQESPTTFRLPEIVGKKRNV